MEFTGERVIAGQVDLDLWNEHFARYAFASESAADKIVLDIACGTGYGSAEIRKSARSVIGIDIAWDALRHASSEFQSAGVEWTCASCSHLPFVGRSFEVILAFEVIEHLTDWRSLLSEAKRVLAPGGVFFVSTPNKSFYAESRSQAGPNPFHIHEFDLAEFREALEAVFPRVSICFQDHSTGIYLRHPDSDAIQVRGSSHDASDDSNFFIGICSAAEVKTIPSMFYVPSSANVLQERNRHIQRLEVELHQKNDWLKLAQKEHQALVVLHETQSQQLQKSNEWAREIDGKLSAAGNRVLNLQEELIEQQQGYEAKVSELEEESVRLSQWGTATEAALTARVTELLTLLQDTEARLEERTRWALSLQEEQQQLSIELSKVAGSRWIRLGNSFGVGPKLQNR